MDQHAVVSFMIPRYVKRALAVMLIFLQMTCRVDRLPDDFPHHSLVNETDPGSSIVTW